MRLGFRVQQDTVRVEDIYSDSSSAFLAPAGRSAAAFKFSDVMRCSWARAPPDPSQWSRSSSRIAAAAGQRGVLQSTISER